MNAGRGPKGLLAEINVTPMADVIIVLLIIFMVTIPLFGSSPVPLPSAMHGQAGPKDELKIVVTASGAVTVGDLPALSLADLEDDLRAHVGAAGATPVRIEAARDADYGAVGRVLDACRRAGIGQIGLAVEPRPGS